MSRYAEPIARGLLARPKLALGVGLIVGLGSAVLAARLTFDTRFSALLPEDTPELVEVNELQKKAGGTQELVIAVAGKDEQKRLTFAREVVRQLEDKPWIRSAVVEFPVDFFLDRRLWFLSLEQLGELKETLDDEIEQAKARANPFYVDLEDEDEREDPWTAAEKAGLSAERIDLKRRYTTPDNKYLFVRVKPYGTTFDMAAGKKMLAQIKAAVALAQPQKYGVSLRYAGGLELNQEQQLRMSEDLQRAAVLALVLILLLMTLYVRRVGAPLILVVPLVTGVVTTLGITQLVIGQLNLVSGFLVSALFGLGIDFEIHLYLRYLEQLAEGEDRHEAMAQAMTRTLPGCVTAATTTSAAFFAMAVSDFRGFREYGIIAGIGVLVTLIATYLVLPPLALALTRVGRPAFATRWSRRLAPRLAWTIVALGGCALAVSLVLAPRVRWHTDFKKLRGTSQKVEFSYYVGDVLGGTLQPAGIFVSSIDEAREVERYLKPLTENESSLVKKYVSLASLVPRKVEKKGALIRDIGASLQEVLDGGKLTKADRERVEEALALSKTRPWTVDEVPPIFRRQFEAVDGQGGHFVIVWPRIATHVDRNIIRWGQELNRIRADLRARGLPVKILDEHRIGARVLQHMRDDAPIVLGAAALVVLIILLVDFRNIKQVLLVASALAVGLTWMLGMMALCGIDLNVFNQAVLATIIGVGIDNVVHIKHRYLQEGPGSIAKVVATTGSAALLASATTAIGFGTAVIARHAGIQSFGALAIIGLTCTFTSSTVFFPAVLAVLERRRLKIERPKGPIWTSRAAEEDKPRHDRAS